MSQDSDLRPNEASVPAQMPLHMRRDAFDPVPALTTTREDHGVTRVTTPIGTSAWLITRYDDVREVLGDAQRFSNAALIHEAAAAQDQTEAEKDAARAGNLLAHDPPEHTRLRRLLTPEFTMHRMRRLEPRITEIVTDHLDAMQNTGPPAELVSDFALPIPSLVICELLGVPYGDRTEFQQRTNQQLDTSLPIQRRTQLQAESRAYMSELVGRAQADPGEDMLGMLVREHGDDLSAEELAGIAELLLVAGHETTSNMLGLGTLALLRHPEQLALVRDEPDGVAPAVEELMRWLSVVHSGAPKVTTTEVEIAGRTIPAGETVMCALPSANRDPALIDDPDRFDVTRGSMTHLAFGHGVHHCLGAPLARMEMRIAFPALLRRFPTLRCAVGFDEVEFRSYHAIYGLWSLPVTW